MVGTTFATFLDQSYVTILTFSHIINRLSSDNVKT